MTSIVGRRVVEPEPSPEPGADEESHPDCPVEEGLVLQQARADPARFAPIYERYFPRVYRYCLRRVDRREEAEDLACLVFVRALAGLREYQGGSVAAWLFRIAHNAVANHLRDRRPYAVLDHMAVVSTNTSDPGEQALARVLREEERQRIAHLVARLPHDQRALLALRIAGQLSAREIGAVLGKSEGAIRVALHRVLRHLRAAYLQLDEERRP
jgi:RNA polymerase sigma-70 factor (ECF subfamily)